MPEHRSSRPLYQNVSAILYYTMLLARSETPKRTFLFFFRSFGRFGLTSRWITFIEDFGRRHGLGRPPANLVRKAFGTYFTMNRSLEERERMLEDHFVLSAMTVKRSIMEALWKGEPTELGRIEGKKDAYIVWLRRADQCGTRHEGEWTAGFVAQSSGLLLCRLTVVMTRDEAGKPSVAIGGLQGPARSISKTTLVTATRDLGGLRPKDAMLLVAAGMARALGRETLYAVDNANHPINTRGRKRRAKMLTDYDDYWTERGGTPGGPFGFVLPARDPSEAEPGNKRRDEAKKSFFDFGQQIMVRAGSPAKELDGETVLSAAGNRP